MLKKRSILPICLAIGLSLFSLTDAFAQKTVYTSLIQCDKQTPSSSCNMDLATPGQDYVEVQEAAHYKNLVNNPSLYNNSIGFNTLKAQVFFEIDRANLVKTDLVAQTIELQFDVDYTLASDPTTVQSNPDYKLKISYDPSIGAQELEVSAFEIPNAIHIKATIKSVDGIKVTKNGTILSIQSFDDTHVPVQLRAEIISDPVIDLNNYQVQPTWPTFSVSSSPSSSNSTITVNWSARQNARWYEVQWMFIDKNNPTIFDYNFRFNSTNVLVEGSQTHYHIPNIYPSGYIFFRVRAVGYNINSPGPSYTASIAYGPWNDPSRPTSGSIDLAQSLTYDDLIDIAGFEPNKNWVQSTSFVESNKRKSVVSYFDGTFKERQTITSIEESLDMPNVDRTGVAIVGQTVYDFLGRPAVNILPVPSLDDVAKSKLTYRESFNKAYGSTQQYNWEHFDVDAAGCNITQTHRMASGAGASYYYGPAGLSSSDHGIHKNYIPDAKGYPFTQVEYTPDNTGRIARASGVGTDHRLTGLDDQALHSGDMHESEFYYEKPHDAELFLLFGSEVGDAAHYQKNVTVDANNQLSVSYIDAKGRVIATALAGDPANNSNLNNVDGAPVADNANKTLPLTYESQVINQGLHYQEQFYAQQDGDHTFEYTVDPIQFTDENCPELCYTCIYDLTLSIKDACGVEQLPGGAITTTVGLVNPTDVVNTDCNSEVSFSLNQSGVTLSLLKGQYTIEKTLTLNQMAIDEYEKLYLSAPCIKTLEEFITEQEAAIEKKFCDYNCTSITQDIANLDDIIANTSGNSSADEIADAIRIRDYYVSIKPSLCDQPTPCSDLMSHMLSDMRPFGQYGQIDDNYTTTDDESIFYIDVNSPSTTPIWRHPASGDYTYPGTSDVIVIKVENGFPEADGNNYSDEDGNPWSSGDKYVRVENLKDAKTFIQLWEPYWAESLVENHPEHCIYNACKAIEPTYVYDQEMNAETDAQAALDKGYFDPLHWTVNITGTYTPVTSPSQWSWFTASGSSPSYDTTMYSTVLTPGDLDPHFSQFPQMTGFSSSNQKSIWDLLLETMDQYEYKTSLGDYLTDDCINEATWQTFRGMYQSAKSLAITEYYDTYASSNSCPTVVDIKKRRFHYDFEKTYADNPLLDESNNPISLSSIISGFYASPSTSTAQQESITKKHCETQCKSYRADWQARLLGCKTQGGDAYDPEATTQNSTWLGKMDDLLNDMEIICANGCDMDHPYGSNQYNPESSLYTNPANTEPLTFEQAIETHFVYEKGVCDALLLTFPLSYDHDYYAYDAPNSDTCACRYTQAYIDEQRLKCPDWNPDMEAYTACACDIESTGTPQEIAGAEALKTRVMATKYVPEEYRCNTCKTCDDVYSATLDFLKLDDGFYLTPTQDYIDYLINNSLPLPEDIDYTDPTFKLLLTNYLNRELGMNMLFEEYHVFLLQCLEVDSLEFNVFSQIQETRLFVNAESQDFIKQSTPSNLSPIQPDFIPSSSKMMWAGQKLTPREPSALKLIKQTGSSLEFNSYNDRPISPSNQENIYAGLTSYPEQMGAWTQAAPTQQQLDDVKCNCEKILNAYYYAESQSQTLGWGYEQLYGLGFVPTDDLKNICCNLFKDQPVVGDPSDPCDASDYTPGDPWPTSQFDANVDAIMNDQSYGQDILPLVDNPCTDNDPNSNNALVDVDTCSCNKIISLYKQHGKSQGVKELLSQFDVTMSEDDFELHYKKCMDAYRFGQGWEDGSKNEVTWVSGTQWSTTSKSALAHDVDFWNLQVPSSITCNPTANPPSCHVPCDFVKLQLSDYLVNNAMPSADFSKFSPAKQTSLLHANNLADPAVASWFTGFESALQTAIELYLPAECLPYTMDMAQLMAQLGTCGNPCPTLSCNSLKTILEAYLVNNAFPTDIAQTATENVEVFDNILAEYEFILGGGSSTYNTVDIQNFVQGFITFADNELTISVDCERTIDLGLIRSLRYLCPDYAPEDPKKCEVCYVESSTKFLEDFRVYLNEIVQGKSGEFKKDLLDKTNWYLENIGDNRELTQYYDHSISELYKWHTDENNLKQTLATYPFPPRLTGKVKDLASHELEFELYFPSDDWMYHFGEIIEFKKISIKPSPLCKKPDVFELVADIYVPKDKAQWYIQNGLIQKPQDQVTHPEAQYAEFYRYEVTLSGRFLNYEIATEVPCFNSCLTLCNEPYFPTIVAEDDCEEILDDIAFSNAQILYRAYIDERKAHFQNSYRLACLNNPETFSGDRPYYEYHHTLYYYDQAGSLIKTVPPEGVDADRLRQNTSVNEINDRILACRQHVADPAANPRVVTNHTLITNYQYNDLGQLTFQTTPDGGKSQFWYDQLGRLVVSQNAEQANTNDFKYSYTKYDDLGRIFQVGEVAKYTHQPMMRSIANDPSQLEGWIDAGTKTDVTTTYYNEFTPGVSTTTFSYDNSLNRIVATTFEKSYTTNAGTYDHATHYSYDIHGNVKQLLQDHPAFASVPSTSNSQQYKQMDYVYELLSGNVDSVYYQKGELDQFIHAYSYDAENRLTGVNTSSDGIIYRQQAQYYYYLHGPLARVELGHNSNQGLDYAYTIHGWIKSVNGEGVSANRDIGWDGYDHVMNTDHRRFSQDAFGFMLHFYQGDYSSIGSFATTDNFIAQKENPNPVPPAVPFVSNAFVHMKDLFNGNIQAMTTVLPDVAQYSASYAIDMKPQMGVYRYDKLNRIKEMRVFNNYDKSGNFWKEDIGVDGTGAYYTNYSYDQNGNIKTLTRNGAAGAVNMDQFTYNYDYTNINPDGTTSNYPLLKSNKLFSVNDAVATTLFDGDIEDMGTFTPDDVNTTSVNEAETSNNFKYDAIGNLISDFSEEIAEIKWNVYGKIESITRHTTPTYATNSLKPDLEFEYGPDGNRIKKIVKPKDASGNLVSSTDFITTYYVLDASGNLMATYTVTGTDFNLDAQPIYGSSRLGQYASDADMAGTAPVENEYYSGRTSYELSNHLGNVLAVITDRKFMVDDVDPDILVNYFTVEYTSITDYYPFGMQMPERSYDGGYRFGFNGMEMDDNFMGKGNSYNYSARLYDTRLTRWLSPDPMANKYPSLSVYHSNKNSPLYMKDPDGNENVVYLVLLNNVIKGDKTQITVQDLETISYIATKMFGQLGLNTQVVVRVDPDFNEKYLDLTDHVAYLGTDDVLRSQMKSQGHHYFMTYVWDEYMKSETDNKVHADISENPGQSIYLRSKGASKMSSMLVNTDYYEAMAFLILHGVGHNNGANHNNYGWHHETLMAIMTGGNEPHGIGEILDAKLIPKEGLRTYYSGILDYTSYEIDESMQPRNQNYILMRTMQTNNNACPVDNYQKNKDSHHSLIEMIGKTKGPVIEQDNLNHKQDPLSIPRN